MSPVSSATTRARTRRRDGVVAGGRLLAPEQIVRSPESGLRYRVERLLGQGGFGQVYLCRRLGSSSTVPQTVCIKISAQMEAWVREAYFGQLLERQVRAIRVYEAFPWIPSDGRVLYCLALEYARHGDLNAFLQRTEGGLTEKVARREIAGILQVLGKLHDDRLLHRDLTPLNVFVCDGPSLKLGDFGIARHQSDRHGVTARTMNALTAPSDILSGAVPKWQTRDDVYQVGQLIGMLVKGDAGARLRAADVRRLECSDHLKEIIYRCISERRKRYESAKELIEALRKPPAVLPVGRLRTLKGVHLAFTGILTKKRADAVRAAKRAGAVVHGAPSGKTTVVVRGRPNTLQAAGRDAGRKLMEIKRLREKGHTIKIIHEKQFWKLTGKR